MPTPATVTVTRSPGARNTGGSRTKPTPAGPAAGTGVTGRRAPRFAMLGGMTPLEQYQARLDAGELLPDPGQRRAVAHLERLHQDLVARGARRPGPLPRLLGRAPTPVPGLYLWGGVGRGKTLLMDLLHQGLPFPEHERSHFHRFMGEVHGALEGLRGTRDPLRQVARDIARRARVLCLDELLVHDIGDAMVLGGLLEALFAQGVTLVTTANEPPEALYRGGLQRERFLPAIALLQARTRVVDLGPGDDHRLRALEQAPVYRVPMGSAADAALAAEFERLAPGPGESDGWLEVLGRPIPYRRRAQDLVWLDFAALCEGPRSPRDYVELARGHHTLLVSGIPVMTAAMDAAARRFVHLVDALYDHNVKLVASAADAPGRLYTGTRLAREFRRTASRLTEMASHAYLARPHRP